MRRFRLYYDKDAEQKWLNEMCEQGWAFEKFFAGVYTFRSCEKGAYHYQIDILDNWRGDTSDFKEFMEENDVEVLSQWYRWVFLRKKASGKPFEMYTDIEGKIKHYTRIKRFFEVAFCIEGVCLVIELMAALQTGEVALYGLTLLIACIMGVFGRMIYKCKKKIAALK